MQASSRKWISSTPVRCAPNGRLYANPKTFPLGFVITVKGGGVWVGGGPLKKKNYSVCRTRRRLSWVGTREAAAARLALGEGRAGVVYRGGVHERGRHAPIATASSGIFSHSYIVAGGYERLCTGGERADPGASGPAIGPLSGRSRTSGGQRHQALDHHLQEPAPRGSRADRGRAARSGRRRRPGGGQERALPTQHARRQELPHGERGGGHHLAGRS